jgi:hypothetical protein
MARISRELIVLCITCGMALSVLWRQSPSQTVVSSSSQHVVKLDELNNQLQTQQLQSQIDAEIAGWSSQIQGKVSAASTAPSDVSTIGSVDVTSPVSNPKQSAHIPKKQLANIVKMNQKKEVVAPQPQLPLPLMPLTQVKVSPQQRVAPPQVSTEISSHTSHTFTQM